MLQDCDDLDVVSITSRSPSQGSRPTVKCSTCSKEFGKASIKFHEPQCERKKAAEEQKKVKDNVDVEEKSASYIDFVGTIHFIYNTIKLYSLFLFS